MSQIDRGMAYDCTRQKRMVTMRLLAYAEPYDRALKSEDIAHRLGTTKNQSNDFVRYFGKKVGKIHAIASSEFERVLKTDEFKRWCVDNIGWVLEVKA